jgi:hypothetical protein
MTAVEWLVEKLTPMNWTKEYMLDYNKEIIEQAKEIEKKQIIDAYRNGGSNQQSARSSIFHIRTEEQYYNETFKK